MKKRYPWKLFFIGVAINFLIHFFWMFISGVVLLLIGIFNQKCLAMGVALLIVDLMASLIEQFKIRQATLADSDNPAFQEFQEALSKDGDWMQNVMDFVDENCEPVDDEYGDKGMIFLINGPPTPSRGSIERLLWRSNLNCRLQKKKLGN